MGDKMGVCIVMGVGVGASGGRLGSLLRRAADRSRIPPDTDIPNACAYKRVKMLDKGSKMGVKEGKVMPVIVWTGSLYAGWGRRQEYNGCAFERGGWS